MHLIYKLILKKKTTNKILIPNKVFIAKVNSLDQNNLNFKNNIKYNY